jgi:hypothetical protein
VSHADFQVSGRELLLNASGEPIGSTSVELLPLDAGLEICPCHLDFTFSTEEARNEASTKMPSALDDLGVQNYVLLDMNYTGMSEAVIFPLSCYVVLANFDDYLRDDVGGRFPEDCEEEPDDAPWWHEELLQGALIDKYRLPERRRQLS